MRISEAEFFHAGLLLANMSVGASPANYVDDDGIDHLPTPGRVD